MEIDSALLVQIKEGKKELPKDEGWGVNYFFMFISAILLVVVTFNTNELVFFVLVGLDIFFIIALFCIWGTRAFDDGYKKLFSCYLYCIFIMCMVVVYSICARNDINTSKNTKLSDTYLVEDVICYEYVELRKNGVLIYEKIGDKKLEKIIPWYQIDCEIAEEGIEQAEPYVYREKRVYEKLNYEENPPTVLEKEVVWSGYIFSGTEEIVEQIMEKK